MLIVAGGGPIDFEEIFSCIDNLWRGTVSFKSFLSRIFVSALAVAIRSISGDVVASPAVAVRS